MNILVCVKQVPESGSPIRIHEDGTRIKLSDSTRFELNPYDSYAVETAVRIKEAYDNTRIDAITVGPERSKDALRRALGMGADEGIHILDDTEKLRPPIVTATWIANTATRKNYDLILCGIMSDDEMNGQTGPLIAQLMGWPCATSVIHLDLKLESNACHIEREVEGGAKDLYKITLPCVLAVQTGINSPRYPSLSKVLRAKKKTFETIDADLFDPASDAPQIARLVPPSKKAQGTFIKGDTRKKASTLAKLFESKTMF